MKRSDLQQIIGCLVEAGEIKLADCVVSDLRSRMIGPEQNPVYDLIKKYLPDIPNDMYDDFLGDLNKMNFKKVWEEWFDTKMFPYRNFLVKAKKIKMSLQSWENHKKELETKTIAPGDLVHLFEDNKKITAIVLSIKSNIITYVNFENQKIAKELIIDSPLYSKSNKVAYAGNVKNKLSSIRKKVNDLKKEKTTKRNTPNTNKAENEKTEIKRINVTRFLNTLSKALEKSKLKVKKKGNTLTVGTARQVYLSIEVEPTNVRIKYDSNIINIPASSKNLNKGILNRVAQVIKTTRKP